jgi:hypothetical protein
MSERKLKAGYVKGVMRVAKGPKSDPVIADRSLGYLKFEEATTGNVYEWWPENLAPGECFEEEVAEPPVAVKYVRVKGKCPCGCGWSFGFVTDAAGKPSCIEKEGEPIYLPPEEWEVVNMAETEAGVDLAKAARLSRNEILEPFLKLTFLANCVGGRVIRIVVDRKMLELVRGLFDCDDIAPTGEGGFKVVRCVLEDKETRLLGIEFTEQGD